MLFSTIFKILFYGFFIHLRPQDEDRPRDGFIWGCMAPILFILIVLGMIFR